MTTPPPPPGDVRAQAREIVERHLTGILRVSASTDDPLADDIAEALAAAALDPGTRARVKAVVEVAYRVSHGFGHQAYELRQAVDALTGADKRVLGITETRRARC